MYNFSGGFFTNTKMSLKTNYKIHRRLHYRKIA